MGDSVWVPEHLGGGLCLAKHTYPPLRLALLSLMTTLLGQAELSPGIFLAVADRKEAHFCLSVPKAVRGGLGAALPAHG